jgi:hypothetical protein
LRWKFSEEEGDKEIKSRDMFLIAPVFYGIAFLKRRALYA